MFQSPTVIRVIRTEYLVAVVGWLHGISAVNLAGSFVQSPPPLLFLLSGRRRPRQEIAKRAKSGRVAAYMLPIRR